jgi:hypothetical protein
MSEENRCAVLCQHFVGGQKEEIFNLCLRHQHAIEGIAMHPRKVADSWGLRGGQREILEGFSRQLLDEIRRQTQFAQALFEPDLPKRDGAHEDSVLRVADEADRRFGKLRIAIQPPQQDMCVQQEFQACGSVMPKASAMSSGRVLKSGAIQISPFMEPGVRGLEAPW